MNILILCTGNSARSILLESILRELGLGRINAFSAGSRPVGQVNPAALRLLKARHHPTSGLRSKSWNEFTGLRAPEMDIVITVCGNAREEECPIWPGAPLTAHWGVKDPAGVIGPLETIDQAFETAFERLEIRAQAFLKLDLGAMNQHEQLEALRAIGRDEDE
ncbi:MAG: arsenate reductase ArsC [Rhodobacteraceae bacterium]|nr:arsenate reductase ArsC [Paracoccaceae bacterium]